jgi:hypothetical protein
VIGRDRASGGACGVLPIARDITNNVAVGQGQDVDTQGEGEGAGAGNQRRRQVHGDLQADRRGRLRRVHDRNVVAFLWRGAWGGFGNLSVRFFAPLAL